MKAFCLISWTCSVNKSYNHAHYELQHVFDVFCACRIQNDPSIPLRMQSVGLALEELLVTAQKQDFLTVGIYESAKLLNA